MQPTVLLENSAMTRQNWTGASGVPLLARFIGKLVLDILPAALASVIGGFLFTQYQFGHGAAPRPVAEQAVPASGEMMAMVRDEHAMIMGYLKSQMAAQQTEHAAEDAATARATADAKVADTKVADIKSATATATPVRRLAAALAAAKPAAPRAKASVASAALPQAPLVITAASVEAPSPRLAQDPDSLLAKTLDLKDHVVAATRQVVSAIGDVFASVGEKIGVGGAAPAGRQFSSAS
jgi:hypothetical protein